jgi:glycosyl transferase family 1
MSQLAGPPVRVPASTVGSAQGQDADPVPGRSGRILLLSMRQVANLVGYCALYEFEDVVADLMGAEIAGPTSLDSLEFSRRVYKLVRYLSRSARVAGLLRPRMGELALSGDCDLFFPVFNHAHELFALHAFRGWRDRSRFAACYIGEAWDHQLPVYLLELLKDFDHVFVGVKSSADAVARICGRPCTFLPMGVDALEFCPHPAAPARLIDVCGIGRRSPVTHEALLDFARRTGRFYYYDTLQSMPRGKLAKQLTFRVSNAREHRMLLANILKRSRYFIANRAWVDAPGVTRGRDEIAARFYEGAAGGAILLGEPPDNEDFRTQFGWTDSVIRMPFDAPHVAEVIAELDADPARSARIRQDNVVNALLRHDWVYRLRQVLEVAGLAPSKRVLGREAHLAALAKEIPDAS